MESELTGEGGYSSKTHAGPRPRLSTPTPTPTPSRRLSQADVGLPIVLLCSVLGPWAPGRAAERMNVGVLSVALTAD